MDCVTFTFKQVVLAGIAARAIFFVEIINVARFVTKALSGRWDTHEVTSCVLNAVEEGCPRGRLLDLIIESFPQWKKRVLSWKDSQFAMVQRVYDHAKPFEKEWPLYMSNALPNVTLVIEKHRDRDCRGEANLCDAFVTSDFIESYFGCLKDSHLKLGKIDITNTTGLAAAKKNHTFDTPSNRLRHEEKRRKDRKEPPMTLEEKVEYFKTDAWGAFSSLDPEEQEWLYLAESKTVVWKKRRKDQQDLKVPVHSHHDPLRRAHT